MKNAKNIRIKIRGITVLPKSASLTITKFRQSAKHFPFVLIDPCKADTAIFGSFTVLLVAQDIFASANGNEPVRGDAQPQKLARHRMSTLGREAAIIGVGAFGIGMADDGKPGFLR